MPHLKPVEKIELSEKHIGWRLAFFILFLVIAAGAFASCVGTFFSVEPGWHEIEAESSREANCGNEFVFLYYLGGSGTDATAENKALKILYTDACEMAHKLFHNKEIFEGVNNVYYMNQHPNEIIEVDPGLYKAFEVIQQYENRNIYMAPVYSQYDEIFYCEDDSQLVHFDPRLNEKVASEYAKIAVFANDSTMVDVQLLGENKIKLYVSEEYLAYAKENDITDFIDFFWMKNAFVTDYLAEQMIARGYTLGTISSYDGFTRILDSSENSYSFNIYDRMNENVYQAAVMQSRGPQSMVYFRNYRMSDLDTLHYYSLSDGEVRTSYVDVIDGVSKEATDSFYAYGKNRTCADVLMQAVSVYVAEELSAEAVRELAVKGIYSIYCEDDIIKYNDSFINFSDLLNEESVKYTTELIK